MPGSKMRHLLSESLGEVGFIRKSDLPQSSDDHVMRVHCSILGDSLGYLMALHPAHFKLDVVSLDNQLGRRLVPVTDKEKEAFIIQFRFSTSLKDIFSRQMVVDSLLFYADELFLPLFSNDEYARLSGSQFAALTDHANICNFSYPDV